jgi:copper chaperone NosL
MSPVSKIVFADKSKAEDFAKSCSGEIVDYTKALETAKASVAKENKMINGRRLKKGKIVEPTENDNCPVCGMYPNRYPYGKCQIKSKDGQTIHFCSTQCLFAFLGKQELYVDKTIDPLLIWVVDRNSGMWISGRTAFYVIGSKKVFGPMGYEALPFNSLKEAEEFTLQMGGTPLFSVKLLFRMWFQIGNIQIRNDPKLCNNRIHQFEGGRSKKLKGAQGLYEPK